jgi:hypothetical protein
MLSYFNLKNMAFDLKDLLEKQAYCMMRMGANITEVLSVFKDKNLNLKDQQDLRIMFQRKHYCNEIDQHN